MKKIILFLLIPFPLSIFAQSDSSGMKQERFSIGAYNNIGLLYDWWFFDKNLIIAVGTNVDFKICKRFSVSSGLEFFGNKVEHSGKIMCGFGPCPIYQHEYFDNKYLDVPLDFRFTFLSKKKCALFLSLRFVGRFIWGKHYHKNIWPDGTISIVDRKNSFQYHGLLLSPSLGAFFRLEKNTKVVIEPNFWGKIFDSYGDYFVGSTIGIVYDFQKK